MATAESDVNRGASRTSADEETSNLGLEIAVYDVRVEGGGSGVCDALQKEFRKWVERGGNRRSGGATGRVSEACTAFEER